MLWIWRGVFGHWTTLCWPAPYFCRTCSPELIRQISHILPQASCLLMTGGVVEDVPEGVPVLHKPFSVPELIAAGKIKVPAK